MPILENEFIDGVNNLIDERLKIIPLSDVTSTPENLLTRACRHLCISQNAKRARPLLCLYYHWMLSLDVDQEFQKIAVAAEFIHAASLLHDDIIDEAERRRGKSAVNREFGNALAVLAGDFLLTEAFDLLRPFDRELSNRAIFVVREMTKAAILELNARGNIDTSMEQWAAIAKGKTGVLFSWCGYAAALFCKKVDAAHRLWEVGERIGLIFQLADDLKDFHGDKNLKDVCRDLRNLEPSLPIIVAMKLDDVVKTKFAKAIAKSSMDEAGAMELRELIIRCGAINQVKHLMAQELSKVMDLLLVFQGTPGKIRLDQFIDELRYLDSF